MEKVWQGQFVEENNLSVQIAALRKIFGEKKGEHRFIATIPGKGYKFVAEINPTDDEIVVENHKIEKIIVEEVEKVEEIEPEIKRLPTGKNDSRRVWFVALAALVFGSNRNSFLFFHKKRFADRIDRGDAVRLRKRLGSRIRRRFPGGDCRL